jgi:cyanophycin synthetase
VPVETGEQAVEVLAELGAPVVVKPLQRDCGPGISAPLTQGKDVHGAYAAARSVSRHVVVERHVPGDAIRVLVVGGEVAGAVRVIDVNDPESRTVDVTGRLHPDTKAAAAEAARLVGLDLAEVLLGARDVALPLAEQGGVVRAVVARPSLAPYASSACVTPLPVADAVLRYLFPNGGDGRIPLVGVTGGPERVEVARLLAQVLERSFPGLGLAAEGSVTVNGRSWRPSGGGAFEAARALLVHPEVTAGIVEVGRRDVLVEGLGFDRCGVAIVAGLDDGAELPITDWGFEEPAENLPRAERCLVDVVLAGGWVVLNGDERRLEPFVEHVPAGARLIVVATDAGNPLVARQVAARERTIVLERGQAVFREGQSTLAVVGIDAAGRAAAPVLAALGGGWAMGLSPVELGAWILERR